MSDLIRCPRCDRYVRASETQCPFCAARSLSKLALPALAIVGLTACPGPSVQSVYAGPPPDDMPPVEEPALEEGGEAAEVDAPAEEAAAPEAEPDAAEGVGHEEG